MASHPIVSAALQNLSIATVPAKYHSECKTSGQVVPVTGPYAESISQIIGALGKVSPTYPQMSAKVTVKSSAKKGRYLVANQKINPGTFIPWRSCIQKSILPAAGSILPLGSIFIYFQTFQNLPFGRDKRSSKRVNSLLIHY